MAKKSSKNYTKGGSPIDKHTDYDLQQMQNLSLDSKVQATKRRIQEWYEFWGGQVYVSVSGIDSVVLKHMVDELYDDVPAVFVNTGLEYPEVRRFWGEVQDGLYSCLRPNVTILLPKMRFDQVISSYGYPVFSKETARYIEYARKALARGDDHMVRHYLYGERLNPKTGQTYHFMKLSDQAIDIAMHSDIKISDKCCNIMKKAPAKRYEHQTGRKPFLGTQAAESKLRRTNWKRDGCNAFSSKRPTSQPLSFWTKQDILAYAKTQNVPFPSCYGEIVETGNSYSLIDGDHNELTTSKCKRTGCMFCMFGCHLEREPNRFQRLKETHPKQYDFCIHTLGLGAVLDRIGVKY